MTMVVLDGFWEASFDHSGHAAGQSNIISEV
jgi:hypothetical protein